MQNGYEASRIIKITYSKVNYFLKYLYRQKVGTNNQILNTNLNVALRILELRIDPLFEITD